MCSTKSLSQIPTRIITAVKERLQKYCNTAYARSGQSDEDIKKNSKELLQNLQSQLLFSVNSIKSFDFSTLYTTVLHGKMKSKLRDIILSRKWKSSLLVCFQWLGRHILRCTTQYFDADIVKILKYLIDSIFAEFGGWIFQQTIGIPNCASLLADLFYTRMR